MAKGDSSLGNMKKRENVFRKVVNSSAARDDRSKNLIVFGLSEDSSVNDDENLEEMIEFMGCENGKPLNPIKYENATRLGTFSSEKTRPIKLTLGSRDDRTLLLQQAGSLRWNDKFSSVFVSPDLSHEDQEKRKVLVRQLTDKIKEDPDLHHYIRRGTVVSKKKEG